MKIFKKPGHISRFLLVFFFEKQQVTESLLAKEQHFLLSIKHSEF